MPCRRPLQAAPPSRCAAAAAERATRLLPRAVTSAGRRWCNALGSPLQIAAAGKRHLRAAGVANIWVLPAEEYLPFSPSPTLSISPAWAAAGSTTAAAAATRSAAATRRCRRLVGAIGAAPDRACRWRCRHADEGNVSAWTAPLTRADIVAHSFGGLLGTGRLLNVRMVFTSAIARRSADQELHWVSTGR